VFLLLYLLSPSGVDVRLACRLIVRRLVNNVLERTGHDQVPGTLPVPVFASKDRGKSRRPLFRISLVPVETGNRYFPARIPKLSDTPVLLLAKSNKEFELSVPYKSMRLHQNHQKREPRSPRGSWNALR